MLFQFALQKNKGGSLHSDIIYFFHFEYFKNYAKNDFKKIHFLQHCCKSAPLVKNLLKSIDQLEPILVNVPMLDQYAHHGMFLAPFLSLRDTLS